MRRLGWVALLAGSACTKPVESMKVAPLEAPGQATNVTPYEVSLRAQGAYLAGRPAEALVTIEAKGGYHVNEEYPVKFTVGPEATVAFSAPAIPLLGALRTTRCTDDAKTACHAEAPLPFSTADAGAAQVAGTLAFSVCSADQCLIEKVPLQLSIAVGAQ